MLYFFKKQSTFKKNEFYKFSLQLTFALLKIKTFIGKQNIFS